MGDIFHSDAPPIEYDLARLRDVQRFQIGELKIALKQMKKGRCRDKSGVTLEVILHAGEFAHEYLLKMSNKILNCGQIPFEWKQTFFTMLHKSGDNQDPFNWRPIAILQVCYKILARLLYNRLKGCLENTQTDEQMGFCPHRSTEDALLILEAVIGQALEYCMPLWFASLGLSKAFDRLDWGQLFQALEQQGVPDQYRHLLAALCDNQTGTIPKLGDFSICRGVKQGDFLSPTLFNAGVQLVDMLAEELQNVGLALNAKKSNIFTSDTSITESTMPVLLEAAGNFIEITRSGDKHKYLGCMLAGDLRGRGKAALQYRVRCAWGKVSFFGGFLSISTLTYAYDSDYSMQW